MRHRSTLVSGNMLSTLHTLYNAMGKTSSYADVCIYELKNDIIRKQYRDCHMVSPYYCLSNMDCGCCVRCCFSCSCSAFGECCVRYCETVRVLHSIAII